MPIQFIIIFNSWFLTTSTLYIKNLFIYTRTNVYTLLFNKPLSYFVTVAFQ